MKGDYYNADRVQFGALRVLNDDTVSAGMGFGTHPHNNMEIISIPTFGDLEHRDSMGNVAVIRQGDVQVMSAGTGIRHAEYNREEEPTRLFQIWIIPDERGGAPSWGTKPFPKDDRAGRFVTLASGFAGDDEALPIRAAARVVGATLMRGQSTEYRLGAGRHAYLVPAAGTVTVNGVSVATGDGLAIRDETRLTIVAAQDSEIVLVDAA